MKAPFVQPEKSRVVNVTIAKSRVLAAQVLRILSRKGFGTFFKASERHPKRNDSIYSASSSLTRQKAASNKRGSTATTSKVLPDRPLSLQDRRRQLGTASGSIDTPGNGKRPLVVQGQARCRLLLACTHPSPSGEGCYASKDNSLLIKLACLGSP